MAGDQKMIVPSSNLLNAAFAVIARQPFLLLRQGARVLNGIVIYETQYLAPQPLSGSIQAVNRSVYQREGLDFQKNYIEIFVSTDVIDLSRDYAGDLIEWNNRRFQITSNFEWFNIDGWVQFRAVEIEKVVQP